MTSFSPLPVQCPCCGFTPYLTHNSTPQKTSKVLPCATNLKIMSSRPRIPRTGHPQAPSPDRLQKDHTPLPTPMRGGGGVEWGGWGPGSATKHRHTSDKNCHWKSRAVVLKGGFCRKILIDSNALATASDRGLTWAALDCFGPSAEKLANSYASAYPTLYCISVLLLKLPPISGSSPPDHCPSPAACLQSWIQEAGFWIWMEDKRDTLS